MALLFYRWREQGWLADVMIIFHFLIEKIWNMIDYILILDDWMKEEKLILTPKYPDLCIYDKKNAWLKQALSYDPSLTPPFWDQNGGVKHSSDTQGSG